MASIRRVRYRKDGTPYWSVLYTLDGKQTSTSWNDPADAEAFRELVNRVGPARARQLHGLENTDRSMTVSKWLTDHIDNLSGVERRTAHDYRAILNKDIAPALGALRLSQLSRDDISGWVEAMRAAGASGKTISNKHRLLSAALKAAVRDGHIPSNPAAGVRLPRTERAEMRFLSHDEFAALLAEIPQRWQPMVRFMVTSGARLSEVTALRPSDVDRRRNTVRIGRAWKRIPGGSEIGVTKTMRSERTINLPPEVLACLDYTGAWLFTGRTGQPVNHSSFRANVWRPAVKRAQLSPPPPRLHDLRHTCASWMIQGGVQLTVVQRHLGHESIMITSDIYSHIDRASFEAAADVLGSALLPPG
jgi:integrase